jgi:hypothetical protein
MSAESIDLDFVGGARLLPSPAGLRTERGLNLPRREGLFSSLGLKSCAGALATLRPPRFLGLSPAILSSILPRAPELSPGRDTRSERIFLEEEPPELMDFFLIGPGLEVRRFNAPGLSGTFSDRPDLPGKGPTLADLFFTGPGLAISLFNCFVDPVVSGFFLIGPKLDDRFFIGPGLAARSRSVFFLPLRTSRPLVTDAVFALTSLESFKSSSPYSERLMSEVEFFLTPLVLCSFSTWRSNVRSGRFAGAVLLWRLLALCSLTPKSAFSRFVIFCLAISSSISSKKFPRAASRADFLSACLPLAAFAAAAFAEALAASLFLVDSSMRIDVFVMALFGVIVMLYRESTKTATNWGGAKRIPLSSQEMQTDNFRPLEEQLMCVYKIHQSKNYLWSRSLKRGENRYTNTVETE